MNCDRTSFRTSDVTFGSSVTATLPGQAVVLRTKRASHHRMMSGNVWDGCKLVRRSYYGPCSRFSSHEHSRQEGQIVTENRYVYQV